MGVLRELVHNFELKMVLSELDQPRLVLYLLVEAPCLVNEHRSLECHGVLLFRAEGEHLVVLLIVKDLAEEEPVAELNYRLLWPPYLCQQLDLGHLEDLKDDQGVDVGKLLAKVANERGLGDKVAGLEVVVVFESAEGAINKVLNLLDVLILGHLAELLLDFFRV